MFPRGVAVCSVLALAAVAQGGVAVQLVPIPNQASCSQNQTVQVDVKLAQVGGTVDQLLRMVEFDLQLTNPFLTVVLPTTHDMGTSGTGDDIRFWSFASLSTCVGLPSVCGFLHFIDDKMAAGPVDTREKILSIAYRGLTSSAQYQILLPASGAPVTVGKLQVTMPAADADYTLNLVNATATGADQGARVDFGIDPHTIWRAKLASPNDVSGGTFTFHVGPVTGACCVNGNTCNTGMTQTDCTNQGGVWQGVGTTTCVNCPPVTNAILVSSVPAFTAHEINTVPAMGTLWRSAGNVVRATFDRALPGVPTAGQILIQEMLPVGAAGPDLSASFAFTLESGNTVLRIRDGLTATPTANLGHRKWYVIRNTGGWAGVANFEAQFPVQAGDASGDNRVISADVLQVNGGVGCLSNCGDQNRLDINGDGRIISADVLQANGNVGSFPVPKPTGH